MRTIKVISYKTDIKTLYKRANTASQRALLGYMVKVGIAHNPIYCGAFNVVRNIEWCIDNNEIYRLYPIEDADTVKEIMAIAQSTFDGTYDAFAFGAKEIDNIIKCMENF